MVTVYVSITDITSPNLSINNLFTIVRQSSASAI